MEHESQRYSWAWLTADQILSHGPCELLFAYLVVSAASTNTYLYDGDNTNGVKIVTLESNAKVGHSFTPPVPIYCRRGLYVDIGSNITGLFIQWRELERAGGA